MKHRKFNLFPVLLIAMLLTSADLFSQVYEPDPKNDWQDPDKSVNDACTSCLGVFHNYVCNPSFDDYRTTINGPIDCENLFQRATTWGRVKRQGAASDHSGTPDLWYTGQQDPAQVPTQGYASNCILWRNGNNTPFGTQTALQLPGYSDQSFVGVGTYVSPTLFTNLYDPQNFPTRESREYIVTRLKQPLKPNTTYTISMYVSLGEISELTTPLQVLVSNRYEFNIPLIQQEYGALKPYLSPAETANIRTLTTGVVDKDGWTKVSVPFNPGNVSNMEYLIIGYFEKDDVADLQTSVVAPSSNPPGYTYRLSHSTYYFIDHVMVEECTAPLVLGRCGEPLLYSQVASLINANSDMLIDGQLVMDVNGIINNKSMRFTENGSIYVNPNIQFSLRNSYLRGCNNMWAGIGCYSGSRIELDNNTIEDGYTALWLDGVREFNVKNCTFDLNEHAVTIRNHTATNYLRQITGTKFYASANCKDPSVGLPKTGVRVLNSTVAPNIGMYISGINQFEKLKTGVYVENSNVRITNNSFNKIGQGNINAYAIELRNPHQNNTPLRTAYIGGFTDNNERNMIYESENGILALGHWKTEIYRNQVNGVRKAISLEAGFRAIGNQTNHHIRQNSIQKARTGVNVEGQGLTSVYRIQRNTISNISSPQSGSIGVRVFDKSGRVGKCSPSVVHYVDSNSIMRFDRGVDFEGGDCSNIRWNKIYTVVAPTEYFERTGIWYRNSSGVNVLKNEVEGTSTEWNRNVGIRGESVSLSDCGCNKVTKTHVALFTGLPNPAIRVFNNAVFKAKDGLLINYGALGNQSFDRNNPAVTLNPSNTFTDMVPRQFYPNGVEAFANNCAQSHTKYFNTQLIRSEVGWPITVASASDPNSVLLRNLCLYLKEKNEPTSYVPTMEALFTEPKIEGGVYDNNHQFLQDKQQFEVHLQDETLKDNSTVIGARIQAIKSTPGALWAEIYMRIDTGDYEGAQVLLNSVSTDEDIELLNLQFAPIYMRYMMQGAEALTEQDHEMLAFIAGQCFVEYGYVVSSSRSLLLHVWYEETTLPSCDLIAEPSDLLPEEEQPEEGSFFTLSPNPATTQVNLNSNFMESCTYSILNGLGNTILTGTANPGENFIGITSLTPGQYHVRLTFEGELLQDTILVVQ